MFQVSHLSPFRTHRHRTPSTGRAGRGTRQVGHLQRTALLQGFLDVLRQLLQVLLREPEQRQKNVQMDGTCLDISKSSEIYQLLSNMVKCY